ncbi:hypothetical protein H6778_03390 [Candidatus Nomurabacteria bacterium]|nr:hypothetical protein [Candidatus Nomurabacteria bacterium]
MVLLIPEDLAIPGWSLEISPREFLLAITIGCIAATLFIKATTIRNMVSRFKLDRLTAVEEIEYQEAQAIIHHQVNGRLAKYEKRGYISEHIADALRTQHTEAFQIACKKACALSQERRDDLAFRVLRIYAIGIEKRHLKLLYDHNEVTESVFRRIQGKLRIQLEAIESGNLSPDVTIHGDDRDIFERIFRNVKKLLKREENVRSFEHRYMYYRAQTIISRKVLKELTQLEQVSDTIFTPEAVKHVNELYTSFKENSQRKLHELSDQNIELARILGESLAKHGVHTIEEMVLEDIYRKELITPKLYILLKEELRAANQ